MKTTIVIVDDNPVNLRVVVESLELCGHHVIVAQDGAEALERAALAAPDLILLDVMMPDMDGLEVCRRLKAAPHTRPIPVIFMTAVREAATAIAAFDAGAADYVSKPLSIAEVRARIGVHLRLRASERALERSNVALCRYRDRLISEAAGRSAQLRAETDAREALDADLRILFENAPDAIGRCDLDGRLVFANSLMLQLLGVAPGQARGRTIAELCPGDAALACYQQVLEQVIACGEAAEFDLCRRNAAGTVFEHVRVVPERGRDGAVRGAIAITRDCTLQKRLEEEARGRAMLFRELVENSPDAIARYDRQCRRVYANPRLAAIMGDNRARVLGCTPEQFPGGEAGRNYQACLRSVLASGRPAQLELRWMGRTGQRCTQVRMSPEFDAGGAVVQVLSVGRDITDIDNYRSKIRHQAQSDALTGLPNRTLLFERIGHALAGVREGTPHFALLMLDLDHFKQINDTLGHVVGDQVLSETATRLLACVRHGDTVARLGGDEFLLLLPEASGRAEVAALAATLLRALAQPLVIDGHELYLSASIGIALCPDDSGQVEALFKYADSAMYHAKSLGRNAFQFYASDMTVRAAERMELQAALRHARRNGELELHYQAQVDMADGRVVGAEALLRWRHPQLGMVMPARFIALAEECGLIVEIGEWVLAEACAAVVRWNRGRAQPLRVAVNLSPRQFLHGDLTATVKRVLAETGCPASWLDLEITEGLLLEDGDRVAATLVELRALDIGIAIDDFCTGYSALSYLSRFAVSQIKIDRSFVRDVPGEREKCALVNAILSIAVALRLDVVAEGIETDDQADFLRKQGCRLGQGYLFGRPMPGPQFAASIAEEAPAPACCS